MSLTDEQKSDPISDAVGVDSLALNSKKNCTIAVDDRIPGEGKTIGTINHILSRAKDPQRSSSIRCIYAVPTIDLLNEVWERFKAFDSDDHLFESHKLSQIQNPSGQILLAQIHDRKNCKKKSKVCRFCSRYNSINDPAQNSDKNTVREQVKMVESSILRGDSNQDFILIITHCALGYFTPSALHQVDLFIDEVPKVTESHRVMERDLKTLLGEKLVHESIDGSKRRVIKITPEGREKLPALNRKHTKTTHQSGDQEVLKFLTQPGITFAYFFEDHLIGCKLDVEIKRSAKSVSLLSATPKIDFFLPILLANDIEYKFQTVDGTPISTRGSLKSRISESSAKLTLAYLFDKCPLGSRRFPSKAGLLSISKLKKDNHELSDAIGQCLDDAARKGGDLHGRKNDKMFVTLNVNAEINKRIVTKGKLARMQKVSPSTSGLNIYSHTETVIYMAAIRLDQQTLYAMENTLLLDCDLDLRDFEQDRHISAMQQTFMRCKARDKASLKPGVDILWVIYSKDEAMRLAEALDLPSECIRPIKRGKK